MRWSKKAEVERFARNPAHPAYPAYAGQATGVPAGVKGMAENEKKY
jgi:hypothetical protein